MVDIEPHRQSWLGHFWAGNVAVCVKEAVGITRGGGVGDGGLIGQVSAGAHDEIVGVVTAVHQVNNFIFRERCVKDGNLVHIAVEVEIV